MAALARLPVLRKSDLIALQAADPPFGGLTPLPASAYDLVHMSPGPIFEPAMRKPDWWRFGRFLRALGVGAGDMVQNCFSYHLTPAGMMMESAATALGATVIPAGTGQSEQQVAAAAALRATVYAGTPDYLLILLDQADEAGLTLAFDRAACRAARFSRRCARPMRNAASPAGSATGPPIWASSPMKARRWRG